MNTLEQAFDQVAVEAIAGLMPWFYKTPMAVTRTRLEELHTLQKILYKAILFFVNQYEKYECLMPLSKMARKVVEIASNYPYRVGTYRPDFLIDEDGEILICEINARRPMEGRFFSGFSECIGNTLAAEQGLGSQEAQFRGFLEQLSTIIQEYGQVCVLKSADRPSDIKYYPNIFEKAGIPCRVIELHEIHRNLGLLKESLVINEFNQMELLSLPLEVIDTIAASHALNDPRTIFLIHDKRFLSILSNRSIMSNVLADSEVDFLTRHIIPTYSRSEHPDLWRQALDEKDRWILKPYLLGRSEKILAGFAADEDEWRETVKAGESAEFILQPFIKQKRFIASLNGKMYQDYVVGLFFGFENVFMGPGMFRASSFPVTNLGDDRKIAQFVTDQTGQLKTRFVL